MNTDLTFSIAGGKFNYRACAVILHEGKLLALRDERSPYFYIPGGRVRFGETAEEAVLREIREELGCEMRISRPLWLNQSFFTEDVSGEPYHELGIYFLMDISETDLLTRGEHFTRREGTHTHCFEWLPLEALKDTYFYPIFLKTEIFSLPRTLTLRTERE